MSYTGVPRFTHTVRRLMTRSNATRITFEYDRERWSVNAEIDGQMIHLSQGTSIEEAIDMAGRQLTENLRQRNTEAWTDLQRPKT